MSNSFCFELSFVGTSRPASGSEHHLSHYFEITGILKELTEYQKEAYKAKLRLDIFCHPSFNKDKAAASASDELAEIKRMYVEVIGKKTFYHELVSEIVQEDHSPNKEYYYIYNTK